MFPYDRAPIKLPKVLLDFRHDLFGSTRCLVVQADSPGIGVWHMILKNEVFDIERDLL